MNSTPSIKADYWGNATSCFPSRSKSPVKALPQRSGAIFSPYTGLCSEQTGCLMQVCQGEDKEGKRQSSRPIKLSSWQLHRQRLRAEVSAQGQTFPQMFTQRAGMLICLRLSWCLIHLSGVHWHCFIFHIPSLCSAPAQPVCAPLQFTVPRLIVCLFLACNITVFFS